MINIDDVIIIKLHHLNSSPLDKQCYMLDLNNDIQKKMAIEYDDKLLNIDTYYSPKLIEGYFNTNKDKPLILLNQYISDVSSTNDKYFEYKDNTIDDVINNGNGCFTIKDSKIYFSTFDGSDPRTNQFSYQIIIYNIQTKVGNVSDDKFTFGLNWLDLVNERMDDTIINDSMIKIREWFKNGDMLKGKSVIDIGCGSGLHSLNMLRLCDNITSIDIDENCIQATNLMKQRYTSQYNLGKWDIHQTSILDDTSINKFGTFDIVYSWGVLHHTGDMWKAIENAGKMCNKNGILFITLYSAYWRYFKTLLYKIKFNNATKYQKIKMIADRVMLHKHRIKRCDNWNNLTSRGMNVYNDIVDWVGGYPYEVATTEVILKFLEPKGFKLIKKLDPPNKACHEWMFIKLT